MKMTSGRQMPDFKYLSPYKEGEQSFADFARGKKTYVVFLRYYGCTVCRLDLHIYAQRFKEFSDKGVQLAVVLQSDPALVKSEAPEGTFPFEIMCDPSMDVYKQLEILPAKSKLALAGGGFLKTVKKMNAAKSFGFEHGRYEGDELQLPAVALISREGVIEYAHYAKNLSDMPTAEEMLAKL